VAERDHAVTICIWEILIIQYHHHHLDRLDDSSSLEQAHQRVSGFQGPRPPGVPHQWTALQLLLLQFHLIYLSSTAPKERSHNWKTGSALIPPVGSRLEGRNPWEEDCGVQLGSPNQAKC
jgi:hypothetical protein